MHLSEYFIKENGNGRLLDFLKSSRHHAFTPAAKPYSSRAWIRADGILKATVIRHDEIHHSNIISYIAKITAEVFSIMLCG
ncbi:uncharacterized protein Thert_01428 [Thermoanaerobacterium thermosaccharolyticum]|uniref:Uncharacterized protein n=1 Tax=Thermoanaerobacterium thermosaccharolyticum TaxID=1517 RepID=A0A223HYD7_THETR|nr:hypothetical protein [Thermoanaerobacterium thermosaccharolyticum]AST57481.1 uncharacterized protein Thert_01428 [Thermoanaerobacterium thermosaccharolyticum]